MGLYLNDTAKYENQLITIHSQAVQLSGLMLAESLEITSNAEFGAAIGTDAESFIKGAVKQAAEKITAVGGYVRDLIDRSSNSLVASSQEWTGGDRLAFSVSFNVFKDATSGPASVSSYADLAKKLAMLTQSKSSPTDKIQQPYYYDREKYNLAIATNDLSTIESSLFRVTIGKWFKASLLLPTSVSSSYSTYTNQDGSPLYCTVTIGFQSYRVLNGDEFSGVILK